MGSTRQKAAARRNIKKAASAAKKKRTVAHLPKATRTALGKESSKESAESLALSLYQERIRFPLLTDRGELAMARHYDRLIRQCHHPIVQ